MQSKQPSPPSPIYHPLPHMLCLYYAHQRRHRNVSSANHQRLLSGARWGGRGGTGPRWSRRRGSNLSAPQQAISHTRVETAAVLKGLVRLQVCWGSVELCFFSFFFCSVLCVFVCFIRVLIMARVESWSTAEMTPPAGKRSIVSTLLCHALTETR